MTVAEETVRRFLSGRRFAVVGASDDPRNFGRTVYQALRDHGYEVVPVNPAASQVEGDRCLPDLASVAGPVDGVVVMVGADHAADVVRDCVERGVDRVWLFRGLGGQGATSEAALRLCAEHGIDVVAGACPLMFLEPVGWFHRVHRAGRRANHSLAASAS